MTGQQKRSRFVVIAACAALLVGASPTSASATASVTGPSTFPAAPSAAGLTDPSIPSLPHPRCTTGQTPLRASGAGKSADGGYIYEYDIAGVVNRIPVPPTSFSPATASAAQLAEYGFPPRPENPAARVTWIWKYAQNFKGVPLPQLCLSDRSNHPATRASSSKVPVATPTADTPTSGNWAGIVGYSDSNFVAVQGDWPQSYVQYCGCGTTDTDESSWSGICGWGGTSSLLQEGTSMQGTGNMFAWYEYLHYCTASGCNPPEIAINSVPVSGGMAIHTYTAYQTSNGQTTFLVWAGSGGRSS